MHYYHENCKFFAINSPFTLDILSNSTYYVFVVFIHVKTETYLIKKNQVLPSYV